MLPRKARNSALENDGTRGGGEEARTEKSTTDETGSEGLEVGAAPAAGPASQDVELLGRSVSDAGASPDRGTDVDAVDKSLADGGVSCSAVATGPGGDGSVGSGSG